MAALEAIYTISGVALTVNVLKTAIQVVAPANQRLRVKSFGFFFDGAISPTAKQIRVRLLRQTTAGTMSVLTGVLKEKELTETVQSSGQYNATAEPTAGDILATMQIHPQSGYKEIYAYGDEDIIQGGGRLGLDFLIPAGEAAVNVSPTIVIEE